MSGFLLASILLILAVTPALAARDARPIRGARRALVFAFLLAAAWVAAVELIYPHL